MVNFNPSKTPTKTPQKTRQKPDFLLIVFLSLIKNVFGFFTRAKKYIWLKNNFRIIEACLNFGLTHQEVFEKLQKDYKLEITFRTYETYFYKIRKLQSSREDSVKSEAKKVENHIPVESEQPKRQCLKSTLTKVNEDAERLMGNQNKLDLKIEKLF